jgi:hypothetical protein
MDSLQIQLIILSSRNKCAHGLCSTPTQKAKTWRASTLWPPHISWFPQKLASLSANILFNVLSLLLPGVASLIHPVYESLPEWSPRPPGQTTHTGPSRGQREHQSLLLTLLWLDICTEALFLVKNWVCTSDHKDLANCLPEAFQIRSTGQCGISIVQNQWITDWWLDLWEWAAALYLNEVIISTSVWCV